MKQRTLAVAGAKNNAAPDSGKLAIVRAHLADSTGTGGKIDSAVGAAIASNPDSNGGSTAVAAAAAAANILQPL